METGGSLTAPDSVRKLQTALPCESEGVSRLSILFAERQGVASRRFGSRLADGPPPMAGQPGLMARRCRASRRKGWKRWLGELARDLKEGSYRPGAVRQVLIPKKQAGKYRALGHTVRSGSGCADGGAGGTGADL